MCDQHHFDVIFPNANSQHFHKEPALSGTLFRCLVDDFFFATYPNFITILVDSQYGHFQAYPSSILSPMLPRSLAPFMCS